MGSEWVAAGDLGAALQLRFLHLSKWKGARFATERYREMWAQDEF